MAEQLHLEIITTKKQLLDIDVDWVSIPGTEGEMGLLPQHVPIVTTLDSGILRYASGGSESAIAVHYGYAQVESDRVTVLPEMAELPTDIDAPRAQLAERKAREEIQKLQREQKEYQQLQVHESKLHRAIVRQSI